MQASLFEFLLIVIVLPLVFFHLWALIDVLRTPMGVWNAAEQNQVLCPVVVLFLSLIGPVLYLTIARPQLIAARSGQA